MNMKFLLQLKYVVNILNYNDIYVVIPAQGGDDVGSLYPCKPLQRRVQCQHNAFCLVYQFV